MSLLSVVLILFLIMDPIGNISSFLKLIKEVEQSEQKWIVIREMLIALIAMLFFFCIGDFILDILQVSEITVRLSSGIILFLVAIRILFPSINSVRANLQVEGEPFIVPLAIPLIAGPSLLATIMLYAHLDSLSSLTLLEAIFISWTLSSLILLSARHLQRMLGNNGLMACERLMGMVLVLLAIQRFMEGVNMFTAQYSL